MVKQRVRPSKYKRWYVSFVDKTREHEIIEADFVFIKQEGAMFYTGEDGEDTTFNTTVDRRLTLVCGFATGVWAEVELMKD